MKIDWKLFKISYPYICDKCGYYHGNMRNNCEGCGKIGTLRKITKKDWKQLTSAKEPHLKH